MWWWGEGEIGNGGQFDFKKAEGACGGDGFEEAFCPAVCVEHVGGPGGELFNQSGGYEADAGNESRGDEVCE